MSSENKPIQASIIIEVAGRPPEHLIETIKDIIEKLSQEKGVKIINQKIHDTVLLPNQKDFYTTFTELEISTETLEILSQIILKYMPSHLEIISPKSISIKSHEVNEIFGEVIKKIHTYDETARIIQTQKIQMEKKLKELKELLPKDNSGGK